MRKYLVWMVLAMLTVTVAACHEEKVYKIGVSQCSQDDWRMKMNDEINREVMFHENVVVEIRSADDSNQKQIDDIRYFADNGFDIIIAAPLVADAITPVIKEVYESGIPVIVFDRNINGDYFTAFQGADNKAIGKAAAHYARHLVNDKAKIIEIRGLKGSTPATSRHDGFVEGLEESGSAGIVAEAYGDWNYDDASRVADSLFRLHPDVDLVYAHNDRMAIGVSEVAARHGIRPRIIGIDAAPEIGIRAVTDSVIDATFLYPTEGHRLIRTALAILDGKPYDRVTSLPVASPVDATNADIVLLQNESLKEETGKIKLLKSQVDDYWSKHSAQTSLFYAAGVILLLLFGWIFLLLRSFWLNRAHQRQLVEQNRLLEEQRDMQKSLNEQLRVATQSKLVFFTNVSHDLRTPLTLIAEPVEQMVNAPNLTPQQHSLMQIANKNVKILHRLINQILDFRKYENGKLDVNLAEVDFSKMMTEWAESFRSMARKHDIRFIVDMPEEEMILAIDAEKIERVFFNLVSNAFKHTPDNGTIRVSSSIRDGELTFSVADNGHGISKEDLDRIFERFYQVDKIHPKGSGIGLSLARAFIELHGGTISAESELGKGSVFTVRIPVRHVEASAETPCPLINENDVSAELGAVDSVEIVHDSEKPLLLIIDDNRDILRLVGELMKDDYNIITASDGKEGVRLATKYVPDIIICDVMMPVLDGLECCRIIKEEISTSHIPVLMLTACSMDEQRVEGYDSGADAYVAKPFGSAVLKARCKSLIANRKRIKEIWHSGQEAPVAPKPSLPAPGVTGASNDIDNEFYNRFIEFFTAEMGNPDLSVDTIASEMGLGRSQFYRKIKALTNYSPVELFRSLRLKQARALLTGTDKSISEVAYEVGFSTPAYFTKCYRDAFGETPSELRDKLSR